MRRDLSSLLTSLLDPDHATQTQTHTTMADPVTTSATSAVETSAVVSSTTTSSVETSSESSPESRVP